MILAAIVSLIWLIFWFNRIRLPRLAFCITLIEELGISIVLAVRRTASIDIVRYPLATLMLDCFCVLFSSPCLLFVSNVFFHVGAPFRIIDRVTLVSNPPLLQHHPKLFGTILASFCVCFQCLFANVIHVSVVTDTVVQHDSQLFHLTGRCNFMPSNVHSHLLRFLAVTHEHYVSLLMCQLKLSRYHPALDSFLRFAVTTSTSRRDVPVTMRARSSANAIISAHRGNANRSFLYRIP